MLFRDPQVKAERAYDSVKNAPKQERSKEIDKHKKVWGELKAILKELSNEKCWYCETKNLRSDNAVDHYRPKGNVKKAEPPHDGYWWLAFDWHNYRFTCTFCNSVRNGETTTGGKQDHFPIHDEQDRARKNEDDIEEELPVLIDPVVSTDTVHIWFDEDGSAKAAQTDEDDLEFKRADISIKRYHLNHPETKEARVARFYKIEKWLKEADEALNRLAKGKGLARQQAHSRIKDIRDAFKAEAEFSAAARCFVKDRSGKSKAAKTALG